MSKVDLSAWPSGIQSEKTCVDLKAAGGDRREHRRTDWQGTPQSLRQEQHLQWLQLQCRWREVSQRERRAKLRNAQIIQDFQRTEATVRDLAARTTAMTTIRADYEKQLQQKCPRRLQKLEEKRTYLHCKKQVELNLNEYLGRQEWEKVTQSDISRGPAGAQSPSSPADPLHLLTSSPPPLPDSKNCYFHTLKNDLMDSQSEDYTQNVSHQSCHPMGHNSWLTPDQRRKSVSQTRTISDHLADASMETRGPQQGGRSLDPKAWGVVCEPAQDQKGETCMSLRRWDQDGGLDGSPTQEADRDLRQRRLDRQEQPCNQSFELDVKPVRLPTTHRGSSERSSVCSTAKSNDVPASPRKKKKEKRGRIQKICTGWMKTFCHRSHDGVASSMETLSGHMGHSSKTSGHSVVAKQRSNESSPNEGETESAHSSGETEKTEKDGLTQEGAVEGPEMGEELGESEETDNGDENDSQFSSQSEGEGEEAEESKEYSKEEMSSGAEESEDYDEEIEGCEWNGEQGQAGEDDPVGGVETSEGGTEDGEIYDSPEQEWGQMSGHEKVKELQSFMPSGAGGEKTVEELEEVEDEGNGQEGEEEEDDSQEEGYSEDDSEEEKSQGQVTLEEGDGEQDEEDGTGSLDKSEEEDEAREDFSKDEEEMNEEKGGSEVEEMGVTDCKEDESGRTTDSDDEIISSQLDDRKSQATRAGWNFTGKCDAAGKMRQIDEENEENETGEQKYQESTGDDTTSSDGPDYSKALFTKVITGDEDGQCSDDEEDIEVLLAPHGDPERQQEKKTPPAVKTTGPWHDSETDSGDIVLDGQELSACDLNGQDDFDDF
ncbi:protein IWS1 homolog A-like [Brienomyrus brachyistius]|uniref:protein IWS1 homolog A-like n=1 Tax=Brienomyrus brachyistius TaxID=42636 RepID=UPI0020B2733F|nr:protein IWS1 homolog A-like [Brienomyrus brachyistius]